MDTPQGHRLATRDDLPALSALIEAAIGELQRPFLDDAHIASSRAIMGLDTQLIDDRTYFVVERGGELAGCGGWSRRATLYGGDRSPGRDAALLEPARDAARVRAMYTHPRFVQGAVAPSPRLDSLPPHAPSAAREFPEAPMTRHVKITLPDGAVREYEAGTTGAEVAADISKSLAKSALAARIDGRVADLSEPLQGDVQLAILTSKDKDTLELIRHDAAHIMARAVQELWPDTKVTIGPVIENGWFYDFDRDEPFTPEDLEKIEARMRQIIAARDPVRCETWERQTAIDHYRQRGEPYKVELVEAIPGDQQIRMYWHGDWQDLCRGPHLAHTGQVPPDAFKLMSVAGAYWRGDSRNKMLQRIYGVAFASKQDLEAHLRMLEEAAKRDHRRIGREMELFHIQEEAPGMVFWHPDGWAVYRVVEDYMRRRLKAAGYDEIKTPQLIDRKLWEKSGHWEKYRENMFIAEVEEEHAQEKRVMALKPMNCPGHVQIFNHGLKSYRDLPLRLMEFGSCHRYEPSGSMHGLMRVRGFTQDDAHIFCTEDQIEDETARFIDLLGSIYRDLGFPSFQIKFSTRPEVRVGSDEVWDKAEAALEGAVRKVTNDYEVDPGEGAFYGPKLDFKLTDAIGREWQCGTLQADFNLPERLDAEYVAADGSKRRPVMMHRAILGSFERFIGILIENTAGRFPLWLAPRQIVVATIVSDADDYAETVADRFRAAGMRVEVDRRNEKINYKVREHSDAHVPVIMAVGRQEVDSHTVSIRRLGEKGQRVLPLEEAFAHLVEESLPPDLAQGHGTEPRG